MVERSIAWVVARGNRRDRYRGVLRNDAWLSLRTAAIKPRRLVVLVWTAAPGSGSSRHEPPAVKRHGSTTENAATTGITLSSQARRSATIDAPIKSHVRVHIARTCSTVS